MLHGDGFSFGLDNERCALRTNDGREVMLGMIGFTAQVTGDQISLGGTCVSRREDGRTGSCLLDFSGTR